LNAGTTTESVQTKQVKITVLTEVVNAFTVPGSQSIDTRLPAFLVKRNVLGANAVVNTLAGKQLFRGGFVFDQQHRCPLIIEQVLCVYRHFTDQNIKVLFSRGERCVGCIRKALCVQGR